MSATRTCPACDGFKVQRGHACPRCRGRGTVPTAQPGTVGQIAAASAALAQGDDEA